MPVDAETGRFPSDGSLGGGDVIVKSPAGFPSVRRLLVIRRVHTTFGRYDLEGDVRRYLVEAFRESGAFERVVSAEELVGRAAAEDPSFATAGSLAPLREAAGPALIADAVYDRKTSVARFQLTIRSSETGAVVFDARRASANPSDVSLMHPVLNAALDWVAENP